jgi:ubiquinone/menaquinone biosynthesis C-methylase UbiE
VLNAGAGHRDLGRWVDGEVVNQDIPQGLHNANIHIWSPLHAIPRDDETFDAIVCNAVLEHVRNPDEVLDEFRRVLKRGGHLYLCVPFMQPEHLDPTDFQRYTKDGLRALVERHGFEVVRLEGVHSVYHTLAWVVHEWLSSRDCWRNRLLRLALYPLLRQLSRRSREYVDSIASAYRVLARKPKC